MDSALTKPSEKARAYIELNLRNLSHNVQAVRSILPVRTKIMAVLKANACGHGDVLLADALSREGIEAFAVATLEEAIKLRKAGIRGQILILGYTYPEEIPLLYHYRLSQTVVDVKYARQLNQYGKPIAVHVKIDTGLHRLGEDCRGLPQLQKIYSCHNLSIQGTYTQLSAADSASPEDVLLTKQQANAFFQAVSAIRHSGGNPGTLHLLSSYGVLNYPELACDCVRTGTALYGLISQQYLLPGKALPLRPVLSLKTRVSVVRTLSAGDSVGYGHTFTAVRPMRIAAVSIGYADGIPRSASGSGGALLIHGRRAPMIGAVCMDQLMVDVTDIPQVCAGDTAVIIGKDGDLEISAETLARQAGLIIPELLSRIGPRVVRTVSHTEKGLRLSAQREVL